MAAEETVQVVGVCGGLSPKGGLGRALEMVNCCPAREPR